MLTNIARDCQTNETIHLFTDDPRTELLSLLQRRTSEPMFEDSKDGKETFQTGWIVAGRWLEVYSVEAMSIKQ
jgi:hypothetical protein